MSADNWRMCPQCFNDAAAAYEERRQAVEVLYGKIPVADFDANRDSLGKPPSQDEWECEDSRFTLREDYQIGIANKNGAPEFFVSYTGTCQVCGLTHSFQKTERVDIPTKEPSS